MLEGQEEEKDDNEDIIVCLEKMEKNIIKKEMWEETKRNNKNRKHPWEKRVGVRILQVWDEVRTRERENNNGKGKVEMTELKVTIMMALWPWICFTQGALFLK